MGGLLRFLVGAVIVYVLVVVGIYVVQDRIMFPGMARNRSQPVQAPPGVDTERLKLANGNLFRIAVANSPQPVAAAVYFDGNGGGDLQSAVYWADQMLHLGLTTIAIEYPGYADSDGKPSVASIYEAAEVAAAELKKRNPSLPVVAIGYSLGTFPALHLASKGMVDKAVLWAPPTSTLDMAKANYWWLPVRLLLRHRFDNMQSARAGSCPVLILHGDKDAVVPLTQGQQVARALGARATFEVVPGLGHEDAPFKNGQPGWQKVYNFVRGL